MPELIEVTRPVVDGKPQLKIVMNFHAGQWQAWNSTKRTVLALAGWQAGKTQIGPPWLFREIKARGPGDYLVACPTYPLMLKKVLPEFIRFFDTQCGLGKFVGGKNIFTFSDYGAQVMFGAVPDVPAKVFFGHAGDPESLESATAKAAWLDEAGQSGFRLESFEAVMGRLSIFTGRLLVTTRPYNLGWLKQQLWDPWQAAGRDHPTIDVSNFRSIDNPAFPKEEYENAKRTMPGWKVAMKYDGLFTRPVGVIYEAFDTAKHVARRFPIPPTWPRYIGLDFGGVNTAAVKLAGELNIRGTPTGRLFLYRTYHPARHDKVKLTPKEHVAALLSGEPSVPTAVGGSASEDEWRNDFGAAGLYVMEPPIKDVEVGIDRVHGLMRGNRLIVFGDCADFLDEVQTYSRELNEAGEPTEKIEDKDTFHILDACRYVCAHLNAGDYGPWDATPDPAARFEVAKAPPGVFFTDDPDVRGDRGGHYGPDDDDGVAGGTPLIPDSW